MTRTHNGSVVVRRDGRGLPNVRKSQVARFLGASFPQFPPFLHAVLLFPRDSSSGQRQLCRNSSELLARVADSHFPRHFFRQTFVNECTTARTLAILSTISRTSAGELDFRLQAFKLTGWPPKFIFNISHHHFSLNHFAFSPTINIYRRKFLIAEHFW